MLAFPVGGSNGGGLRRTVGLGVAVVLAVGVVIAVIASVSNNKAAPAPQKLLTVKGVIGSEKRPFFEDARVQTAFRRRGLIVQVDTAGSRQIATSVDLSAYDFAFPAGAPAAAKIKADRKLSTSYAAFYTPMVIASWKPIADLLVGAGVAKDQGGWYSFDVARYLDLVHKGTRWTDLPDNTAYPASKSVLITSTDVRTSNSAAMYLSIASYVANGDNVVQNAAQASTAIQKVAPLFLEQGFTASSSEEPFDDYLAIGIGKTPMVMIYEAQFLARKLANDPAITPDMVLMYPSPDVLSKHTFVPLNADGDRVGQLLLKDPTLLRLEVTYGLRTADRSAFEREISAHHIQIPGTIVDLVEPPTFELLESMITGIENLYQKGATP